MARKTGEITVNGATLFYEVSGEGEPLVLVHAGIADLRMWDPQVNSFSRSYRVVRHDMRGFGRSPMVPGPYAHHEDLRALLDHLGVDRATLVGCSLGGATTIDFALQNPGRVEAIILVGSAIGGFQFDAEPPKEWDELVAADEAGDLDRVSELEVGMWVDGPNRPPDAVDPAIRDLVREMNLIALQNEALELGEERELDPPAVDRLPEIQAPTLILVGDEDQPRTLAAADLLAKELPNSQKTAITHTAHLPNMERPEKFNNLVLSFLRSQERGPRSGPQRAKSQ